MATEIVIHNRKTGPVLTAIVAGGALLAFGAQHVDGRQQTSQTPQPKDNSSLHLSGGTPLQEAVVKDGVTFEGVNIGKETSEAWVRIDNPVEFTVDGKKYVWLFDNSTYGMPPNDPNRKVAKITQFINATKDRDIQIPQTLLSKEISQGPGISIGIVGIGIDASIKQAIIIVTTSASKPDQNILHAILVKDITNLKDTMERITEVGLSDSPIQGAGTPTKIINDSTGHYAEVLVQSSLDPANDGKRRLNLDQLVRWVKLIPRAFLQVALNGFRSQ